jgi:hypothetical protein
MSLSDSCVLDVERLPGKKDLLRAMSFHDATLGGLGTKTRHRLTITADDATTNVQHINNEHQP